MDVFTLYVGQGELVAARAGNESVVIDAHMPTTGHVTMDQIEKAVDEIEMELRKRESIEIPSAAMGDIVLKRLKKLDELAYIRFASVYRSFDDLETFEKEVKSLIKDKGQAS